jgi:dTDP-4-dehydrorhamnose reductase
MKILLTGRKGQLGFELQRALAPLGEVVAVDSGECDLADAQAIRQLVRQVAPDLIVNPAAFTAVDAAEDQRELVMSVNAAAPEVLGQEAHALGIPVFHYSTDYVFDGSKPAPYTEEDPTSPLSVYGQSKEQGEARLQAATPRHLIMRTSWVFGMQGQNFAKTMLRLAQERDELRVVCDQFGAPTPASLLADLTALLVRQIQTEGPVGFPFGLYHVSASGETSWCDYARHVLEQATIRGYALKVTPDRVTPISTDAYPTRARRPGNSRLDTSKFRRTFGLQLPPWQQGLNHTLQQIL